MQDENQWWAVSVNCPLILEDTVYWQFSQLGARGTASQRPLANDRNRDGGEATPKPGRTLVTAYFLTTQFKPADFETLQQQLSVAAAELDVKAASANVQVRWEVIAEQDWAHSWKAHWQPEPVGDRFLINPAWMDAPNTERIVLTLDPGSAFGTGSHPTTQLCLKALEQQTLSNQTIADIGCGSGILSIAALKLGARKALATDVDPLATKATRSNAELNGVEPKQLAIELGSVAEAIALAQGPVDGIVCNILSEIIVALILPRLSELAKAETWGILGGILDSKADWVEEHLIANGWQVTGRSFQAEWCAMTIVRASS